MTTPKKEPVYITEACTGLSYIAHGNSTCKSWSKTKIKKRLREYYKKNCGYEKTTKIYRLIKQNGIIESITVKEKPEIVNPLENFINIEGGYFEFKRQPF